MFQKYFAIIERGGDGEFGVFFPDIDGCTSGGKTIAEAITNAGEVLQSHVELLHEFGEAIPEASADPGEFVDDPEIDVATIAAIDVLIPEVKERYNVNLDRGLVAAIDAVTTNRSVFLAEAALASLRQGSVNLVGAVRAGKGVAEDIVTGMVVMGAAGKRAARAAPSGRLVKRVLKKPHTRKRITRGATGAEGKRA